MTGVQTCALPISEVVNHARRMAERFNALPPGAVRESKALMRRGQQALAVIGTVGLDATKVNPMGGAIALGHPLGATGAIRSATVVHALRRNNLKYGMVTMCVGTGQGAAGIFERL